MGCPGHPAILHGPNEHRRGLEQVDEGELDHPARVGPLELFFDLVFVFALTQVTKLMADNSTWEGLGQGLLASLLRSGGPGGRTPGSPTTSRPTREGVPLSTP